MSQNNLQSLIATVVGVIFTAVAWIVPEAPILLQISVSILSLLLIFLSQIIRFDDVRPWMSSVIAFIVVQYPLIMTLIISIFVLFMLSNVTPSPFITSVQFIITGFLAASLTALVMDQQKQPYLRIVKGLGDAVYLVENGIRRHIPDPPTHMFVHLDTFAPLERISDLELSVYREANPLPSISSCELVKGSGSSVYVIWEGRRKLLTDEATIKAFFDERQPKEIPDTELEKIPRAGTLPSILSLRPSITIQGDVGAINVGKPTARSRKKQT